MSGAALAWSLSRACAAGALPACSCAEHPRAPPRPPRNSALLPTERFKWGGCGDNIKWADRFSKQFLEAHEVEVRDGKIGNLFEHLHFTTTTQATTTSIKLTAPPYVILVDDQPVTDNTTAKPERKRKRGRKRLPRAPRRKARPKRKRYRYEDRSFFRNIEYRMAADDPRFDPQVALETRLNKLRSLIATANLLNYRFGRKTVGNSMRTKCTCHGVSGSCAVRTCWRALPSLARTTQLLIEASNRAAPLRLRRDPPKPRLRYVTPSPDYCEYDEAAGSLGTSGRKCNASLGQAPGGCAYLCCGRGRRTLRSVKLERCRCKYHWCCRVECQVCRVTREEHYCN